MAEGGPSPKHSATQRVSLAVEIVRRDPAWTRTQLTDASLRRAARAALSAAPARPGVSYRVTLVLTGDEQMRDLNRTWRGQDKATNVLSFPADAIKDRGFLGDLVLAYETTKREASEQSISFSDHVLHLVVHGMLHLLGFDHAEDEEAERMETVERTVLAALGVADPYAGADPASRAEASS